MLFFNKNKGVYYCADCRHRFNHFFEGSLIHRCPRCLSANTYEYSSYKDMQKMFKEKRK